MEPPARHGGRGVTTGAPSSQAQRDFITKSIDPAEPIYNTLEDDEHIYNILEDDEPIYEPLEDTEPIYEDVNDPFYDANYENTRHGVGYHR